MTSKTMWDSPAGFGSGDLKPMGYMPNSKPHKISPISSPKTSPRIGYQRSEPKCQAKSTLVALPMEIKVQVYDLAFDFIEEVHVMSFGDGIRALDSRCILKARKDDGWGEACDCDVNEPKRTFFRADHLLCACQQMANEVSDLLYNRLKFDFHDPCTLLKFASPLPDSAMASIKYIYIDSRCIGDNTRWERPLHHWPSRISRLYPDAYPLPSITARHFGHKTHVPRIFYKKGSKERPRIYEDKPLVPSTWGACCAALTTMTSLRTLRISVSISAFCHIKYQLSLNEDRTWWIDHGPAEDFILRPLEMVAQNLAEAGNEGLELDVELAWAPDSGLQRVEEGWETKWFSGNVVKRRPIL